MRLMAAHMKVPPYINNVDRLEPSSSPAALIISNLVSGCAKKKIEHEFGYRTIRYRIKSLFS